MEVCIVIPTAGKPGALEACLRSIVTAVGDHCLPEVRVVIDGAFDSIRLRLLNRTYPHFVFDTLISPSHGPAAARNFGAASTRRKLIAFLDDDTRVTASWWTRVRFHARHPSPGLVAGQVENGETGNPYAEVAQDLVNTFAEVHRRGQQSEFANSACFLVPRAVFFSLGGFDEGFRNAGGEDRDFSARAVSRGIPIAWDAELSVRHHPQLNLRAFWQQNVRYGRGSRRHLSGEHANTNGGWRAVGAILLASALRSRKIHWHLPLTLLAQAATLAGRMGKDKPT